MAPPQPPADGPAYPYGERRLEPAWGDGRAQTYVHAAALAALLAILWRWPLQLADLDDVALRHVFPALLAAVLALAPRPAIRLGRVARDLTVLTLIAATIAGDNVPLMIASFPVVLALAALLSRTALAKRLWPEPP